MFDGVYLTEGWSLRFGPLCYDPLCMFPQYPPRALRLERIRLKLLFLRRGKNLRGWVEGWRRDIARRTARYMTHRVRCWVWDGSGRIVRLVYRDQCAVRPQLGILEGLRVSQHRAHVAKAMIARL